MNYVAYYKLEKRLTILVRKFIDIKFKCLYGCSVLYTYFLFYGRLNFETSNLELIYLARVRRWSGLLI